MAETIQTIDGAPWTTMAIGRSCGPEHCTLEVSGGHPDAMGDDVWSFDVVPASETVTVVGTSLGSVPRDLAERADATARGTEPALLEGLVLASATWMLPPDAGRLLLAYRSGDEEGSCRRDGHRRPGNRRDGGRPRRRLLTPQTRRAEAAGPDEQHLCREQAPLAVDADLGHDDLQRVAAPLVLARALIRLDPRPASTASTSRAVTERIPR